MSMSMIVEDAHIVVNAANVSAFLNVMNDWHTYPWKTLVEYLEDAGFQYETNDSGDYTIFECNTEIYSSEDRLWKQLAPYIKDGGYLELRDEFGELCRWKFKDGKLHEIYPKVTVEWPE